MDKHKQKNGLGSRMTNVAIRITNYDVLQTCIPADGVAAAVIARGSETKIDRSGLETYLTKMDKPPLMSNKYFRYHNAERNITNITGKQKGELLVLGLQSFRVRNEQASILWVAQCKCKRYVFLTPEQFTKDTHEVHKRCGLCASQISKRGFDG